MLSKIYGAGIHGTDGFLVCCETDVGNGFPQFTTLGCLSGAAREALDRVRTAVSNCGIYLEPKRVTVNLTPADVRKDSSSFDLPIAVSLLAAYGMIPERCLKDSLFAGELSLGGELLPAQGVIAMVSAARDAGLSRCFLPIENVREGSVIEGISCYGIRTLSSLLDVLTGKVPFPEPCRYEEAPDALEYTADFSDICGQELIKRATLLAVCGRHNILYIGPAGTGKSMVASRIPTIMPRMSMEERLSLSRVYSISGLLDPDEPLIRHRPFRSPHHTISPQALAGGGLRPRPGEISLATNGVLFLDELPEFRTEALEALRQPLEEKKVTISRVSGSYVFPANFQLVCAMNPCRCGFWPDRERCRCTEAQVRAYIGRISKPLLDRIDICAETALIRYEALKGAGSGERSSALREKVERVRETQEKRLSPYGLRFNSEMDARLIDRFCSLSDADNVFLKRIYEKGSMSARGLHKILRVARTAADLAGSENILHEHLAEAIGFRTPESKYWGSARILPPGDAERRADYAG